MGRPRKHTARTLWDAIQYIAAPGCQRAQLPGETKITLANLVYTIDRLIFHQRRAAMG